MPGALPTVILVLVVVTGIWTDGWGLVADGQAGGPTTEPLLGTSQVLLLGAGTALLTAMGLALGVFKATPLGLAKAFITGIPRILPAMGILLLAWALGSVCGALGTGVYLAEAVGTVPGPLIPAATFLLAALASFGTGTSWGVMAILFPLVIPAAHPFGLDILIPAIGAVLAGSVFGDHCALYSDTTVLSAAATDCNLVAHVRTQLPYALVVAAVGLGVGELGVGFGLWPWWVALPLGFTLLGVTLRLLGRPTSAAP